MQQPKRHTELTISLLSFGLLAGMALTADPAQAASGNGPYYAEPAWDQKIPTATRFIILTDWNSEAVLDRETGLVWERSPANTPPPIPPALSDWFDARLHCARQVNTGDRKGWRLPSVHELASLMLPSVPPPGAMLPSPGNNPFSIWAPFIFWSATSATDNPGFSGRPTGAAWFVDFGTGEIDFTYKSDSTKAQAWCVRGGNGGELY